jgi:hypothetical protein
MANHYIGSIWPVTTSDLFGQSLHPTYPTNQYIRLIWPITASDLSPYLGHAFIDAINTIHVELVAHGEDIAQNPIVDTLTYHNIIRIHNNVLWD